MTTIVVPEGGLYTVIGKDGGTGIELYGPYVDEAERGKSRQEWLDAGALEAIDEIALKLTVRGAVEIETF